MMKMMKVMAAAAAFGCATYGAQAVLITGSEGTTGTSFESAEGYSTSFEGPNGGVGSLHGQGDWVRHRVRPGGAQGTVAQDNQFRVVDSGGPGAFHGSQYLQFSGESQTRIDLQVDRYDRGNYSEETPFIFRGALAYGSADLTPNDDVPIVGTFGYYLMGADDSQSFGSGLDNIGEPSGYSFGLGLTQAGVQVVYRSGTGGTNHTAVGPALDPNAWYIFEVIQDGSSVFNDNTLNVYDADNNLVTSTSLYWRVRDDASNNSNHIGWVGLGGLTGGSGGAVTGYYDAIPEPASLALIGMGGLLMLRRKRN